MKHDTCEAYSSEIQERVETVFLITEIKSGLAAIRREAERLRSVFLNEEEWMEIKKAADFYDQRIVEMCRSTVGHLDMYQQFGWKELMYDEEGEDESAE